MTGRKKDSTNFSGLWPSPRFRSSSWWSEKTIPDCTGLPSGNYTLEVAATGFPTVAQPVTLTAPAMTDTGNVLVTAGP